MNYPKQISKIPAPPLREDDSHKGTFGTVIIIAGSFAMPGAPALTARAAFRSGCGLVKIATDKKTLPISLSIEPSATGIILDDDFKIALSTINSADPDNKAILAIGPGLGKKKTKWQLIENLLQGNRTVVLDADGLNLLARAGYKHTKKSAPLILTPHPGEFGRLAKSANINLSPTNPDQRTQAAIAMAKYHSAVVVLKGNKTIVTDSNNVFINNTGNPALATAGSGDVLTGAIASFLAQGLNEFDAAVLAVNVHGKAGDLWSKVNGKSGLLARELADYLTQGLNEK